MAAVLQPRRVSGAAALAQSYGTAIPPPGGGGPAPGVTSGSIRLPRRASLVDKQDLAVQSHLNVAELTFDSDGLPVIGAPASLSAGDAFGLRFDAQTQAWYRAA